MSLNRSMRYSERSWSILAILLKTLFTVVLLMSPHQHSSAVRHVVQALYLLDECSKPQVTKDSHFTYNDWSG